jgi:hypothetical protein
MRCTPDLLDLILDLILILILTLIMLRLIKPSLFLGALKIWHEENS